jgi:hypothetical protein
MSVSPATASEFLRCRAENAGKRVLLWRKRPGAIRLDELVVRLDTIHPVLMDEISAFLGWLESLSA